MSLFPEEDVIRRRPVHEIGQDLTDLSLADIDERIAALRAEIARLDEARAQKSNSRSAADSLFGKRA